VKNHRLSRTPNPVPTRCNYCQQSATHVWRYQGYLAACIRRPQPIVYVATCDDHAQAIDHYAHRNPTRIR